MTISKADLEVIQTVFGKTAEEISGALSSTEEVPLGLKLAGKVYKPEEVETLKTDNQNIGIEIGYKKVAKAADIKLDAGDKDPVIIAGKLKAGIEGIMEAKYKGQTPSDELKAAQEAKLTAENKYKVLLGTHDGLKEELTAARQEKETLLTEYTVKERDNNILSHFPKEMKMDRADGLLIVKNLLTTKVVDGVEQHSFNGRVVTDKLGNPAPLKDAVAEVVETKGWIKGFGKADGDNKPPSGTLPSNLSNDEAMKYIVKQGKEPMSTEGSQMMLELTKDFKD